MTKYLFKNFFIIGLTSLGATTTQVIIKRLIDNKKILSKDQLEQGLAIASIAPGPFHVNLVMNLGYQLYGFRGQVTAVGGFCLPGIVLVLISTAFFDFSLAHQFFRERPLTMVAISASIAATVFNAFLRIFDISKRGLYSTIWVMLLTIIVFIVELPLLLIVPIALFFAFTAAWYTRKSQ